VAISTHIYAGWDPKSMMIYSVIAVLISVLATVYPAWKAGKLQPVESMKHV
jgi:ABC-type lipoprotein release transport system permease subunit